MTTVPRKIIPTVRLRRLAAELRLLRANAELTREAVATHTGIDAATLYRIETAKARPQQRTLRALLDVYRVEQTHREHLIDLSKESNKQGWLQSYHYDLPDEATTFVSFEGEATGQRAYESLFIPGLLQTEDYMRAVMAGGLPMATEQQVDDRVQARMARKGVFTKAAPLNLWAIVDEAALHRMVGSTAVMAEQLDHLVTASSLNNVTLQVIPFSSGAHAGMPGAFTVLDFADPMDADLVFIDSMAGDLFLEAEADISRYSLIFDNLRAVALSPGQSVSLITRLNQRTT